MPSMPLPAPAYKIYNFLRVLRIIRYIIANMFMRARITQINWLDSIRTVLYLLSKRPWFIRYPGWLILPGMYITAWLQYLFSFVVVLCFLVLYIPLALLWLLLAFVGIRLYWIYRLLFTRITHVALHCPSCYSTLRQPIYLCASCEGEHPALHPSSYGVFAHRCRTCQTRLPTLDILGRERLKRICSSCHRSLSPILGTGIPVHIPLIGGPATGKTSLLTGALTNLCSLQLHSPIAFLDSAQEQIIATQWQRMIDGKAITPTEDILHPALIVSVKSFIPQHIYFYDPSGEAFLASERILRHAYYTHASGLILLIDPATIPAFYRRRQGEELIGKIQAPGNRSISYIYERFMHAFESFAGLSTKQRYTQPIAVVITRVDRFHLEKEIGRPAVRQLMARHPGRITEAEATHKLVRAFLCDYDLENVVRDLEAHFTQVRYFVGTYPVDTGNKAKRSGTRQSIHDEPLIWLLRQVGAIKHIDAETR
jgi:hypothetical protein